MGPPRRFLHQGRGVMLARKKPAGSAIRIEVDRRFEVSVREGFDYITDPANRPEYWPRFVRLDPASRWHDRGDRARLTLRLLGRDVELDMALARREPCRVVEYTSEQRGFPGGSTLAPLRRRRRRPSPTASPSSARTEQDGEACSTERSSGRQSREASVHVTVEQARHGYPTRCSPPSAPAARPAVGQPRAYVRRREPPLPSPRSLCRSPRTRRRRTHDAPLATHRVPVQRPSVTCPTQLR